MEPERSPTIAYAHTAEERISSDASSQRSSNASSESSNRPTPYETPPATPPTGFQTPVSDELMGNSVFSANEPEIKTEKVSDEAKTAFGPFAQSFDAVNALLNLPPPPAFDLVVNDLTVGVPCHRARRLFGLLQGDFSRPEDKETVRRRTILNDVSVACASGEVLAILGGSGSGKTTLLNAVAHRLSGLPVRKGDVSYISPSHAEPLGVREARRRIGFVRQQDYFVECLTVRETLTYAARLRLPTSLSRDTISMIVEQTVDELGLRDAADTVVGGPLRKGISGGERRRLSIGCVLVTLPSVLILDEPTSGLDAFTSYLLLRTLSQLARRGRTIVVSIHAPRSDAFELFDRIALLSKGRVVYSGRRGACLPWFSSLGYNVERGVNPLDFLVDISSVDNRTVENEEASMERVAALTTAWATRVNDTDNKALESRPLQRSTPESLELHRTLTNTEDQKRPGFWLQTRVLTSRANRSVYRNVPVIAGLIAQGIILGVFIGVTYADLPETPQGIQSLKNLSFQLVPSVFYLQQVFWIYKFCNDLVIFDREREDNLYDVIPWVVSDWLSFLMPALLSPTLFVIILYFIVQLRLDDIAARLFTIIASTILVQFTSQGLALFAASVTRAFAEASLIGNAINIFQILSAGFIIVKPPVYAAWVRWLSPYFYSFRIVATTLFKDRKFDCPPMSAANLEQCDGNNVLRGFDMDYNINIGAWFGGLIAFALIEYSLSCLILWVYHAGGVRHASEIDSHNRGKQADVTESKMTRDRIDVETRGLEITWRRRGVERTILHDANVYFPSGQVSAILGPSGAGKSTLLQLLAGRKLPTGAFAGFYKKGDILFNGQPANSLVMSNVAFVEQEDDWHLPSLTVRETLHYAAILRLPDTMPRKQKVARAETVLRMLGLKDCADLPVGGALIKGISGGEKRRLSLAVQMINDPAVLLVDEPTSGLDSSIALSVMQVLKDIAATGRTIIATIHQPRSDIWKLADNVTLLAKGGLVAFSGKQIDAIPYFSSIGYPMPSAFFNPADHLLDIVSVDPRAATHESSAERVKRMTDLWGVETGEESSCEYAAIRSGSLTTPMRIALPLVISRHFKNLFRQTPVFINRFMQAPFVGALFILFFQRLTHGPQGAQDRIGITIQSSSALAFVGLLNAMAVFPAERNLYLHESASSARYSSATFVLMYTLVELVPEVLAALAYGAIMNIGVGMQSSVRIFFEYSASIWALCNMGESYAMCVSMWINSDGLVVTILSTWLSLTSQISGVISLNVPRWLAGIAWVTCFKAAVKIQVINECIGLVLRCSPAEIANGKCIATSGEQILALFGWRDLDTTRFTGILVATAVAWRVVAYLSVTVRVGGFR